MQLLSASVFLLSSVLYLASSSAPLEYRVLGVLPLSGLKAPRGRAQQAGMKVAWEEEVAMLNVGSQVRTTLHIYDTKVRLLFHFHWVRMGFGWKEGVGVGGYDVWCRQVSVRPPQHHKQHNHIVTLGKRFPCSMCSSYPVNTEHRAPHAQNMQMIPWCHRPKSYRNHQLRQEVKMSG